MDLLPTHFLLLSVSLPYPLHIPPFQAHSALLPTQFYILLLLSVSASYPPYIHSIDSPSHDLIQTSHLSFLERFLPIHFLKTTTYPFSCRQQPKNLPLYKHFLPTYHPLHLLANTACFLRDYSYSPLCHVDPRTV